MSQQTIVVVGGGMMGLATALALASQNQRRQVVVLEQGEAPQLAADAPPSLRVSAINHASRELLDQLGVWSQLPANRLGPYQQMQVWEANSFARVNFDAAEVGAKDLGAIVENAALEQLLWQAAERAGVRLYEKVSHLTLKKLSFDSKRRSNDSNYVSHDKLSRSKDTYNVSNDTRVMSIDRLSHSNDTLKLSNDIIAERTLSFKVTDAQGQQTQHQLQADFVIAADGIDSTIRQQAELPTTHWDYEQRGLVAVLQTELPHQGIARQVFMPTGPLALLPLADPHQVSMVWSYDMPAAEGLLKASTDEFMKALQVASDNCLGKLQLVNTGAKPIASFPLRMRYAQQWLAPGVILVGDAAHSIHPLAGQGANLGFADVRALQQAFSHSGKALERALGHYQRERKAHSLTMIAAMEAFKRGFGNAQPAWQLLRGLGFSAAQRVHPLRKWCARIALGEA